MARRMVILAGPLAMVGLIVGLAWLFQRSLIYFPDRTVPSISALLATAEEVSFTTEDNLELDGWLVPALGPERAAIVVFNGNAGNRADRAQLARSFAGQGFTTLLFDYRGYGGNPGRPSEPGLIRDGKAAASYLASRTSAPLVFFGESLGSAVATEVSTQVAARQAPAALILRSPFSSLSAVGRDHYWFLPVGWLLKDDWRTVERIPEVAAPVLVVASRSDEIVSYRRSEEVFAAAPDPKQLLTFSDARHNDHGLTSGPRLIQAVVEFVEGVLEAPGTE